LFTNGIAVLISLVRRFLSMDQRYYFKANNTSYLAGSLPANVVSFYNGKFGQDFSLSVFPMYYTSQTKTIINWDLKIDRCNWTGFRDFDDVDVNDYGGISPPIKEQIFHDIWIFYKWKVASETQKETNPFTQQKIFNDSVGTYVIASSNPPMPTIYGKNSVPEDFYYLTDVDNTVIWAMDAILIPMHVVKEHITHSMATRSIYLKANEALFISGIIDTDWVHSDITEANPPSWCGHTDVPQVLFQAVFRFEYNMGRQKTVTIDLGGDIDEGEEGPTLDLPIAGSDGGILISNTF